MTLKMESEPTVLDCSTLPERIMGVTVNDHGTNQVSVKWNSYTAITHGSRFLRYEIKIENISNNSTPSPNPILMSNTTSILVRELEQQTTYSVAVRVVTSDGSSLFSDGIKFTTLPEVITGLETTDLGANHVSLRWNEHMPLAPSSTFFEI